MGRGAMLRVLLIALGFLFTVGKPLDLRAATTDYSGLWVFDAGSRTTSCPQQAAQVDELRHTSLSLSVVDDQLTLSGKCVLALESSATGLSIKPDQTCTGDLGFAFHYLTLKISPDTAESVIFHSKVEVTFKRAGASLTCVREDTGSMRRASLSKTGR